MSAAKEVEAKDIDRRTARLREAVGRAGGAAEVARRSGVPVTSITNYLGGRDMKASALVALSKGCRVSVEWLATGIGAEQATYSSQADELATFGAALEEPAHYWALLTLIRACREFYERFNAQPTLAEVLSWVAREYGRASKLADLPIEFKDPQETAS